MSTSDRIKSGSITKGSYTVRVGEDDGADLDLDLYRQGRDIRTFDDLSRGVARKIRSNSSLVRTLSGRDISTTIFNDTLSPTVFSGSSVEVSSMDKPGSLSYRINHEMEQRDLGQTSFYEDGTYFEPVNPEDPIEVINILDRGRKLPASLVDHSSLSSRDGKIDPLDLISTIDRSSTDFPYPARGVKGAMQQHQDLFLNSGFVEPVYNTPGEHFIPTSFYLDAPENFGNVLVPSVVNFNRVTINPFVEVHNGSKNYYDKKEKFRERGNLDILGVLTSSNVSYEDAREDHDRISVGGFVYESGETDSIVFGGLKR